LRLGARNTGLRFGKTARRPRFQLTYLVESAFAQNSRSCASDLCFGIFLMAT
jgi:hypothetical protein